jgi:hypothetical protein
MNVGARFCRFGLPLVSALVAGASAASAATFDYSSYGLTSPVAISISSPTTASGEAGQIVLTGAGLQFGTTLDAWCLDIYDTLLSSGTYNVTPLTGSTGGSNPVTLSSGQIGAIGALMAYGDANIGTANVSAATQIAIWEVEYPTFAYNPPAPGSAVQTLASALYSDAISGAPGFAPDTNVTLLYSCVGDPICNQSLGYVSATPLPGALILFGSVLFGGLGVSMWRKQNHRGPVSVMA